MTAHSAFQTAELEMVLHARTEVGLGGSQLIHGDLEVPHMFGFCFFLGVNMIQPVRRKRTVSLRISAMQGGGCGKVLSFLSHELCLH